jgi:hypothetical protein
MMGKCGNLGAVVWVLGLFNVSANKFDLVGTIA